jgi:NH3-dependent NAD+ synthetase
MSRAEKISSLAAQPLHGCRHQGFVFGLSGGIDSAVVAKLCQMAAPQRVLGVILPCYSHPQDETDARLVASAFSIPVAKVDLEPRVRRAHRVPAARHKGPAPARGIDRHQASSCPTPT